VKRIILSALFVLLILTIIAVIAEVGFRIDDLFDKRRGLKNSMGNINRKYCHGFKPGSRFRLIDGKHDEYDVAVKINNYGFRGEDISLARKPGTARIMAIGDSFTFGVGAREDETIPYLIGKYLREEKKNTEVINAGFGSYSPLLHYLKVRDEYTEFKPDLVLYFFDFSDLADDWRYEKNLVYDASGSVVRCDPAFIDGKRDWWKTLRMHSKVCVFIHRKIVRLIDKIRILGLRTYIKAKMEGKRAKSLIVAKQAREKELNPIQYDGYLMIRGRDRLPLIRKHFKRNEKYLNLIRNTLSEEGIPMILVAYPYGIHVGPGHWGTGRGYWGFEKGRTYDDYYAFGLLEDYARRNGIPYINLLPAFLNNSDKELFFDIDGHFTPEANRLAARAIVDSDTLKQALNKL